MADLEVSVATPGAEQSAQSLGKVAQAGNQAAPALARVGAEVRKFDGEARRAADASSRMAGSFDSLRAKVGSGGFLRTAAASASLLAVSGSGAIDKMAAIGGALAGIAGPIGLAAGGIAVLATGFSIFSRNAEEAKQKAQKLKQTLAELKAAEGQSLTGISNAATSAALATGSAQRASIAEGGTGAIDPELAALFPGDPKGALAASAAVAGLPADARSRAIGLLSDARSAGRSLGGDTIKRAVAIAEDQAGTFGAGDSFADVRQPGAVGLGRSTTVSSISRNQQRQLAFAELTGLPIDRASAQINNIDSGSAQALAASLSLSEAPGVRASLRAVEESRAGTNVSGVAEALARDVAPTMSEMVKELRALREEMRLAREQMPADERGAADQ